MWVIASWKKVFNENKRTYQSSVKTSDAVWEQDVVSKENEMIVFRRTKTAMIEAM